MFDTPLQLEKIQREREGDSKFNVISGEIIITMTEGLMS